MASRPPGRLPGAAAADPAGRAGPRPKRTRRQPVRRGRDCAQPMPGVRAAGCAALSHAEERQRGARSGHAAASPAPRASPCGASRDASVQRAWQRGAVALPPGPCAPVGRVSRPCGRCRRACARAWPRAWLPSDACARASVRPWRGARAAWRRRPAVALVQVAPRARCRVRCRSSSRGTGLRSGKNFKFHTRAGRFPPRHLSTEFVHNHVDRAVARGQTASAGKGLHRDARDFASAQQAPEPAARGRFTPPVRPAAWR
jgi:hypothetical protein